MEERVKSSIEDTIKVLSDISGNMASDITLAASKMKESIKKGGKVVIFGNGGSAADAQHIAAELIGRFRKNRDSIPALALTTNTSILTSVSNDYGFKDIFSRQVSALVNPGDAVIAISTSGNSENIIEGIKKAREKNAYIIGFTGESGGSMADMVDLCLKVPSGVVSNIQEGHITIGHILCMLVEE
ncbi:MAG: D-sedoheptulose 7-phosphate isomerase [Armatimonadota bacterium]